MKQNEDTQKVDPTIPSDALKIIDILTRQLQLTRENGNVFNIALETLKQTIESVEK